MTITIKIKKAEVYDEIAKLSGYVGAKTIGDTGLNYDRVFTTDDDREMLERFWREATDSITSEYRRLVTYVTSPVVSQEIDMNEIYSIYLSVPSNFNEMLTASIESMLRSYCINLITAKWFLITNKNEAEYYMAEAQNNAVMAKNKLFNRMKPIRTEP